jgi:hypothetical protein
VGKLAYGGVLTWVRNGSQQGGMAGGQEGRRRTQGARGFHLPPRPALARQAMGVCGHGGYHLLLILLLGPRPGPAFGGAPLGGGLLAERSTQKSPDTDKQNRF